MIRNLSGILVLTVLFLTVLPQVTNAKKQSFRELSSEILETLQSFYPVKATEMGIHAYDRRLADYSSGSIKEMIGKLGKYQTKLASFAAASLPDSELLDLRLVRSNVDIALHDLKVIAWYKRSPQLYVDEIINGVYFLMLSPSLPVNEKLVSIVARMKAVPDLITTARKNLAQPPTPCIEAAAEALESGMQFYAEVAGELARQFPGRADNILETATRAREEMNDFATFLQGLPAGEEKSFAIGKEAFDYRLKNEYFLGFDSDSLLKIGEAALQDAQTAYREYEESVAGNHLNATDSVFVPAVFTQQDILDYYNWETQQEKVFLKLFDIVTVPDEIASVTVVETPAFMRAMVRGIAYQPAGPFDSVQLGYFYVRPVPDSLDREQLEARYRYVHRRGFRGSVVHEAYPGHHLQMQIAGMNPDPVRKWQTNNMMVEGWALYCEEMMYGTGLFGESDPAQWLGVLGGIRFRAARIVADVKLHTGRFTYQECVDWMNEVLDVTTESGRDYIRTEVRRYLLSPTYQMSYLMGKREIMQLKEAMMKRDGDSFSLKAFHDAVLAQGSIPPTLLWDILHLKKEL
jgi:uncharacterized protein (DUF885 family)